MLRPNEGKETGQRLFFWQLLESTHNSQTTKQVIELELKCNKVTKLISWICQELQKKLVEEIA